MHFDAVLTRVEPTKSTDGNGASGRVSFADLIEIQSQNRPKSKRLTLNTNDVEQVARDTESTPMVYLRDWFLITVKVLGISQRLCASPLLVSLSAMFIHRPHKGRSSMSGKILSKDMVFMHDAACTSEYV